MKSSFQMSKDAARHHVKVSGPSTVISQPSQTEVLRRAIVAFASVDDYVREIETLWGEAAETFLLIGRWLNKAKETLAHGEYQRMVEEKLPFDRSRAYQLRQVALMVDKGWVAETDLPRSSGTAFLFASLDNKALIKAKQEGVLRPDARRQDVIEWKRQILGTPQNEAERRKRLAALQARIEKYKSQLALAEQELAALKSLEAEGEDVIEAEGEAEERSAHHTVGTSRLSEEVGEVELSQAPD
jgi:hypothetical protein